MNKLLVVQRKRKKKLIPLYLFFKEPSLSTPSVLPTQPLEKVRSWTWMTISTSGVCQRTKWGWSSPLRCGQHCSTTATWAASGICSLTDRVRMSGAWLRSRRLPGSSPPALRSLPNSVWATPAKTMGSVERAGTAMCVTALGLDTWDAPVKEVGVCFYLILSTLLVVEAHNFCLVGIWICHYGMLMMLHSHTLLPCYALSWGRHGDRENVNIIDIKDTQKKNGFNYVHYRLLCLKGTSFQVQAQQHHQTKASSWCFYLGWWLNISSSGTANWK